MFECYFSCIHQRLPDFLTAFYIVGSIALDEFSPYFSDVDFVAVINHSAIKEEIEVLRKIHRKVEREHLRWKLSGMYLLRSDLGKSTGEIENLLAFHDGILQVQSDFEMNPVTWWILKNHGIALLGSDPRDLAIPVDPNSLVEWTIGNMNTYWKKWTQRPGRLVILFTDWGIQWTVLGILRQLYTIRENSIITKKRAGEYAFPVVPQQWHRIIREAIRIRTKAKGSLYRWRFKRTMDTVHFMNYIIHASNVAVKQKPGK
jgi:hypothetical protein